RNQKAKCKKGATQFAPFLYATYTHAVSITDWRNSDDCNKPNSKGMVGLTESPFSILLSHYATSPFPSQFARSNRGDSI
ncbi:hypothetical protein, partial [Vibrio vulnificus]|uniref:hypothetical protein n=1 Tax=Vibrio vulnificus TaxID=672 RepID=UPI0019D4A5C7